MKSLLLFLTLLVIGFASCKKDDSDKEPTKSSYYINGIQDITLQKAGSGLSPTAIYQTLALVYEHSDQERVTLSLEGVPQGVKYRFSTVSGVPSFNSVLSMIDSGVAPGDYPLILIATGTNSGRKAYQINLSVLAAPDCSQEVTGNGYNTQLYCGTSGTYVQNITQSTGQPGRILFSNFDNTGAQVYGLVICNSNQLSIPNQIVNGVIYEGSGYYGISGNQRVINITYSRNSTSCNMQLRL